MHNEKKSLKFLGLVVLLIILGLAGCKDDEEQVDPLIGIWVGTYVTIPGGEDFTINMNFKADDTFTETMVDIPPTFSVTFSGTYVHDSAAKTVTATVTSTTDPTFVAVGYTQTGTYSLSADNNTMTFTDSQGTGTFTRQ